MALIKAIFALALQLSKILVAVQYIIKLLAYAWHLLYRIFRRASIAAMASALR